MKNLIFIIVIILAYFLGAYKKAEPVPLGVKTFQTVNPQKNGNKYKFQPKTATPDGFYRIDSLQHPNGKEGFIIRYYDPEGKLILSNEDGVTTTYSTPTPTTTL